MSIIILQTVIVQELKLTSGDRLCPSRLQGWAPAGLSNQRQPLLAHEVDEKISDDAQLRRQAITTMSTARLTCLYFASLILAWLKIIRAYTSMTVASSITISSRDYR